MGEQSAHGSAHRRQESRRFSAVSPKQERLNDYDNDLTHVYDRANVNVVEMLQLDAVDRNYVCARSDLKVQNSTKAPGNVSVNQKNQGVAGGNCLRQRI